VPNPARPRLIVWPCGLHQGPIPIPSSCPICARVAAEEAARPPVPGYGKDEKIAIARERQRVAGGQSRQSKGLRNVQFGSALGEKEHKRMNAAKKLLQMIRKEET
jgi:hypothetical protein